MVILVLNYKVGGVAVCCHTFVMVVVFLLQPTHRPHIPPHSFCANFGWWLLSYVVVRHTVILAASGYCSGRWFTTAQRKWLRI